MENIINDYFAKLDKNKWESCPDKLRGSQTCVDCFSRQYFNGNEIDYKCIEKRNIYVIKYFPTHVSENKTGLHEIPDETLNSWEENSLIRVLSIGGGPGSDLCAFLDFAMEKEISTPIEITKIDIEPLWKDISQDLVRRFSEKLNVSFKIIDGDALNCVNYFQENYFNIIFCSYLISELPQDNLQSLGVNIRFVMKEGGVLIINDRPQEAVQKNINEIFSSAEIKVDSIVNSGWSGYIYPNEIRDFIKPKLTKNSIISFGGFEDPSVVSPSS